MQIDITKKRLLDLRESKNLSQSAIGKILGVTQAQYNRIEKGVNELSYDGITKLVFFYETSADYILGLTNEIKPYPRAKKSTLK